jgi:hypothetical protein
LAIKTIAKIVIIFGTKKLFAEIIPKNFLSSAEAMLNLTIVAQINKTLQTVE